MKYFGRESVDMEQQYVDRNDADWVMKYIGRENVDVEKQ